MLGVIIFLFHPKVSHFFARHWGATKVDVDPVKHCVCAYMHALDLSYQIRPFSESAKIYRSRVNSFYSLNRSASP